MGRPFSCPGKVRPQGRGASRRAAAEGRRLRLRQSRGRSALRAGLRSPGNFPPWQRCTDALQ